RDLLQMENQTVLLIIVLMAVVTAACRILPVFLLGKRCLPESLTELLAFAPVAILTAMIAPSLFLPQSPFDLGFSNPYLWISLPTIWVASRTRNIAWTALSGMALAALWHVTIR